MSVSYTGDATMDEPVRRDPEGDLEREQRDQREYRDLREYRWKDKIEVRLDNRQVFFLFFGSALCACMLFVLGVIVGKRLESRGRASAPEVQDPLAVLDRINTVGTGVGSPSAAHTSGSTTAAALTPGQKTDQALTFPKALIGAPGKGRGELLAKAPAPNAGKTSPTIKTVKMASMSPAKPTTPAPVAKATPAPPVAKATPAPPVAKATLAPAPAVPAFAAAPAAMPAAAGAKGRFTLQLSSFPDKTEAESFAKRFSSQGAYVVVSDVPGKGTWYRVRVGSYASSQEAIAAKGTFERQNNVIAYIAGR
jgi:DedD protein